MVLPQEDMAVTRAAADSAAAVARARAEAATGDVYDRKRGGGWARGTLRRHCPRLTRSPRSLWSARAVAHHAGCPGWLVQAPSMAVAVAAMAGRVASADVAALRAPQQQGGSLRRLPMP
jgi:hypothetical protein